jgi:hypothetical protein
MLLASVAWAEPLLEQALPSLPMPSGDITPAPPLRPSARVDEPGSVPAPPLLLRPDTPPAPLLPPLIPAPALAVHEPFPARSAANCIQRDQQGRLLGWVDRQQCIFSGRTLATAVWFDDLFGDWHDREATLLLRAVTEITTLEGDGTAFRFRLRASAALPNASQRLRLIVTDDSETDEDISAQDVRSQLQSTREQLSAALRWIPLERAGLQSDFDIGVRGLGPPDIFARARLRKSWNVSRDSALHFGETLRYGSESRGRAITQLDYEYAVGNSSLARFSSAYEYRQEDRERGFSWAHGVSMSHVLGGHRSLGYGFTVNGHTRPSWSDDNYGPWILYRSNWLRPWLFYELEPRLTWYEERNSESVLSLTLRIEIHLGKK